MEADNLSLTRKERRAKANREATLKKPIVSPRIRSNPFDFIFFTWFGPILRLGFRRPIQHSDLPTLPDTVKTENCYPEFRNRWNSFLERSKATEKGRAILKKTEDGQTAGPLFKTLYRIHAIPLAWALFLQILYNGQQFAGPLLLKKITTFLDDSVYGLTPGVNVNINYLWAALMFVFPMIGAVAYVHSSRLSIIVQIKMRAELTAAVYRKALALSSRSRQQTELGKIVNLMSADVNHVMQFFYPFFNQLFSAPALLIASLILLYFQIRWATFIGMAILLASTPTSAIFVKKIIMYRRKMLKETDSRVKLTNQLLSGIRVLKIYAWEAAQEAQIQEARERELRRLKQAIPSRVGMQTLLFAAPVLAAVASFAVYGSVDPNGFTAPRIFAAISLFAIMRFPLIFLPFALVEMGNAMVSLRRLSQYLVMEERNDTVERLDRIGLDIQDGQFYWSEPPATKKLDAVKGAPGQGKKRSLLSVFGGLKLRKGPAIGTGPVKDLDNKKDDKVEPDDVAITMDRTQDASKLGRQVAPGESSSSSSSSSSDGQAEPFYSGKPVAADPEGKEGTEMVSTANDASSGQVKKGSNTNPTDAPDATWWLRDVNVSVAPGELVCVVGRVGSGKSSLIGALLGEMERHAGSVRMGGRLAYVAQQAWIVNDSLQSNVLFGQELDERRWDDCVHACSLQQDLEMLPGGVDTEIGEKGINLSGGQKQRISLARAVYSDADFYIMDDPLSAVDVHVGRHIFDHCISGVLAKKTRLLVTNQLQYLPKADKVIYIESGRVVGQGSFEKVSLIPGFASLLNEFNSRAEQQPDPEEVVAMQEIQKDQMFGELNAAEGRPNATTTSTIAPPHGVQSFASTVPVVNATVGEAYADFGNTGAVLQRNLLVNDTDAVEPLGENVQLIRQEEAADEAGLDLDDAVTRQASGELRRYTVDAAAARSGGAYDTSHRDFTDPELIGDDGSQNTGLRQRRTAMTDSQRQLQLEGTSGRDPDATPPSRTWGGSFRRSKEHSRRSLTGTSNRSLPGASRRSLDSSRRSLEVSRRSLEAGANSLVKESSKKKFAVGAAPEEVVNKDGKVFVKTPEGKLVVQEDRASGHVTTEIYKLYGKAYGWYSLLALCFFWASEQSTNILTSWWLSQWTTAQIEYQIYRALGRNVSDPRGRYLGGYIGFGLGYVILVSIRSIINLLAGWQASRRIHHASMASLCLAPISFFDTTPIGRILNRFAKDTDDMDYLLPQSITELGNCLMQLAATLIFVSIVQPIFLAGMVPLMVVYFFLQKYYRRSYVELQRCDATSRSPVYAHFSESLTGVETIRAFRYQERFACKSDGQIDYNHRAYWTLKTADQWLSLRLDFIGSCLILLTAMLAIAERHHISPAIAALSLSQVLDVTQFMKYAVQSAAMFESRFNSVERILAYAKLKPEAPHHIVGKQTAPSWPQAGVISFQNVVMKYRPELEPVLKGVSFEVAAGEKVGIVGRTGSGKSSLIVTLFRIVEPDGGVISLDGLDLGSLGLNDVRGRIAAIPQDPVLFSGTVRSNLDPYGRHEDHELWEALGHVALKVTVSELSEGLGARVAEGGDNFSVGQRQLLCVARALLRKPKVLVADEATASVDGETDALIQRTIRANFKDSTVLTIAHRLNTILDSTKVLVMEDGRVKEYDSPANLMQIPNGTFRAMVVEAGLSDDSAGSALQ